MKILIAMATLLMLTSALPAQETSSFKGTTLLVYVDGLACPFCANGLHRRFEKFAAVQTVDVNLDKGLMTLQVKPGKSISQKEIKEQIDNAGFTLNRIVLSKKTKADTKKT